MYIYMSMFHFQKSPMAANFWKILSNLFQQICGGKYMYCILKKDFIFTYFSNLATFNRKFVETLDSLSSICMNCCFFDRNQIFKSINCFNKNLICILNFSYMLTASVQFFGTKFICRAVFKIKFHCLFTVEWFWWQFCTFMYTCTCFIIPHNTASHPRLKHSVVL